MFSLNPAKKKRGYSYLRFEWSDSKDSKIESEKKERYKVLIELKIT